MQAFAEEYNKKNIPIFPVNVKLNPDGKAGKYPMVSNWQNTRVEHFKSFDWSRANAIGMITGEASGTLVLDLDIGHDLQGRTMPVTPCQRTGSGGLHYFFKYIKGIRNSVGIEQNIDIRCDGGYVVIAPSFHPKGQYEWLVDFDSAELAQAPAWLVDKLLITKQHKKHDAMLAYGTAEGSRNETAAKVIGHILSKIHQNYWLDFGLAGLREWNKRNTPPLPDDEIVATYHSIASRQITYGK